MVRRVSIPTRAARIAMLIGFILLVASLYFFFAPLDRTLANGVIVHCGSPVHPDANPDALVACAALPGQAMAKGSVLAAMGLLLVLSSTLVFGSESRLDTTWAAGDEPATVSGPGPTPKGGVSSDGDD
jgi:hypothetical protein